MSGNGRSVLNLSVGARVLKEGRVYEIRSVLDTGSVVGRDLDTGRETVLRVADLLPPTGSGAPYCELEEIDEADLEAARFRLDAIRPLLELGVGRKEVEERAREIGVHYTTLYRWLNRYEAAGSMEALLPRKRGRRRGDVRLPSEVETIIQEVIEGVYLTRQRSPVQKVVLEVRRRCLEAGLQPPHANTVRARVAAIHPRKSLSRRGDKKTAEARHAPAPGIFPGADYPLACVQIDHTPVDVVLVDDEYRLPIGRPWITLAIDVFSRMVAGFYVSLDAPSVTSVAMCVAHAVLPKDEWLARIGQDLEWPAHGLMDTIHVDNGPEFHSSSFRDACAMHGINLEYRPVRRPRFGGHIERLLGTLLKEIHDLPGTTFSSVKERGEYKSDKHAAMTLKEFEAWLAILICKVYHKRVHSGIGMPPLKKWEIGLFGDGREMGRGLPKLPGDRVAFMLDFLPRFRRTIQPVGATIDGLTYFADVLRPWVGAPDPDNPKIKRKFTFRRDPRDISSVWFLDPELRQYFKVPFANQAMPSMSIWEYQQARDRAREEGMREVDERQILEALEELREQARESVTRTKKARRHLQKRREHKERAATVQTRPEPLREDLVAPAPEPGDDIFSVTEPLGEIE